MTLVSKSVLAFSSEAEAAQAAAILSETLADDAPLVLREAGAIWLIECYDDGGLAGNAHLQALFLEIGLKLVGPPRAEALPQTDWVAETQKGLPPVHAGRFIVHGSHDAVWRTQRMAIEIDAGRAFGTAHHGTTRGCLLAIDRHAARHMPRRALDLGTGSGILAIAVAKATHHRCQVRAVDNDPIAVEVAKRNCLLNGVGDAVRLAVDDGKTLGAHDARFGFVTANILARPLIGLAQGIHASIARGGLIVLSGMLDNQAPEVVAAYLARGFAKVDTILLEGWTTAVLRRML